LVFGWRRVELFETAKVGPSPRRCPSRGLFPATQLIPPPTFQSTSSPHNPRPQPDHHAASQDCPRDDATTQLGHAAVEGGGQEECRGAAPRPPTHLNFLKEVAVVGGLPVSSNQTVARSPLTSPTPHMRDAPLRSFFCVVYPFHHHFFGASSVSLFRPAHAKLKHRYQQKTLKIDGCQLSVRALDSFRQIKASF